MALPLTLDGVDAFAQQMRQLEHHIFFFGAARAYGTGVFAPMAGIQGNDDEPVGGGACCR